MPFLLYSCRNEIIPCLVIIIAIAILCLLWILNDPAFVTPENLRDLFLLCLNAAVAVQRERNQGNGGVLWILDPAFVTPENLRDLFLLYLLLINAAVAVRRERNRGNGGVE